MIRWLRDLWLNQPRPRADRYSVVQVVQWKPPVYVVKAEGLTHFLALGFMEDMVVLHSADTFAVVTDLDVSKAQRVGNPREHWMREWNESK